jgi:hypothetical protein
MHMRNDLCSTRAVILHNIVVGHARDGGDGAGEEGKPEAFSGLRIGDGVQCKASDLPISLLSTASISATLTLCCRVVTSKCPTHKSHD